MGVTVNKGETYEVTATGEQTGTTVTGDIRRLLNRRDMTEHEANRRGHHSVASVPRASGR
jgi:hypothetical protein